MVTKFDVFLFFYEKKSSYRIINIVKGLNQKRSEYDNIRKILSVLLKKKIIIKNKFGYEIILNKKNQDLFGMLKYCVKNDINYNELFDKNVAKYISDAFSKKIFQKKDIKIYPRKFLEISFILEKSGFLIMLSRKPFKAILPYTSFLGDLVNYYGIKFLLPKIKHDEYFVEIKKELKIFKKLIKINNKLYQELIETFQIKFIHHSLSIEGNLITLKQTMKLLKDKIVPENLNLESVYEVKNYQNAFFQMISHVNHSQFLTKESILNYHFIALQNNSNWAGKIRTEQVIIKGNPNFKIVNFKHINLKLDDFIIKYNLFFNTKKHTLKEIFNFASYIHNEFQHIHPFYDGNSRITRILLFHFLQMNNIPIFDIPLGLLEKYISCTKGAKKRDDYQLSQILQQIILYNLKTINSKLK